MTVDVRRIPLAEAAGWLDEVARLRIGVFRDWPYLYDGSLDYERAYLRVYSDSPRAVLVGAFEGGRLVGAATGTPMVDHDDAFAAPLAAAGWDADDVFYCAESVLLPEWRGKGIGHRFFDEREAAARADGFSFSVFASVIRPDSHPMRPAGARDLGPFWRGRGYRPLDAPPVSFRWRDVGQDVETAKPLALWGKRL